MKLQRNRGIHVEADLKLERLEGTTCLQTLVLSSQSDGSLTVACTGALPSASWGQLRGLRALLYGIAEITEQDLVVTNDGTLLVRVVQSPTQGPKVSIRWWAVARQMLFGSK
jgi:hypothetical protein